MEHTDGPQPIRICRGTAMVSSASSASPDHAMTDEVTDDEPVFNTGLDLRNVFAVAKPVQVLKFSDA